MTKEEFEALGLDSESAAKCATASAKELEGYVSKAEHEVVAQSKETLELQAKEYTKQINLLKKSAGDNEKLTRAIADLQEANKKAKSEYDSKVRELQTAYAVEKALTEAHARNTKSVEALLDFESLELDEKGKLKGLDKQIKKLQEDESTAFLFESKPNPKDGKPKLDKPETSDTENKDSNQNKTSIGAKFAKAYNALMNPAKGNNDSSTEGGNE